jgi:hypothetical protein
MKEFKVTINDKDFELFVRVPSQEEITESNIIYSTKMSSLIRNSGKERLLLRTELEEFLKENKIWTDKDIDLYNSLQDKVSNSLNTLKKGGIKLSEGRKLAIEISDNRRKLLDLVQKRHQYEDMTMESLAEEEKNDYLIYVATIDKSSGERYWVSFDDMKADKHTDVYDKARVAFLELTMGVPSDLDSILPETVWLKKYNFINNEYKLVDRKTGDLVNRSGDKIEQSIIDSSLDEVVEEKEFIDDYI